MGSPEGEIEQNQSHIEECPVLEIRSKLHKALFLPSRPRGEERMRKRAAEKYPTREKRMKRFQEQLIPSRLKKKEIKLVGAILEGVTTDFMEDENAVESVIRNLYLLMSHPCAEKYAQEYELAKSLLALTQHHSPDVVGCAWKVLALNMHSWASEFCNKIQAYLSGEITHTPEAVAQPSKVQVKDVKKEKVHATPDAHIVTLKVKPARRSLRKRKEDGLVVIGCIALDGHSINVVKKAARITKGARFTEISSVVKTTHAIVGLSEPSVRLAIAVADGAFLMSMDWVKVSMRQGYWVAEGGYEADIHLSQIARHVHSGELARPLEQVLVSVYKGNEWSGGHLTSLEKLAKKLGAIFVPARSCAICVVAENSKEPGNLPSYAKVVSVNWIINLALEYKFPEGFWQ